MSLRNDLTYSIRLLRKTPVHTATTLFVMVLGLSLYLASYNFAKLSTDKPMPFPDGERYVVLKTVDPVTGFDEWRASAFDLYTFNRLKSVSDSYSVLAAVQASDATISDDSTYARRFRAATLSTEILIATSVNPILGRMFTAEDSALGANNVALISYSVWQDYYAGDPNIVGRSSQINGQSHNIIGVMPDGFNFPIREHLWLPLRTSPSLQPNEGGRVSLAGILRPGVTEEAAEAELIALSEQLVEELPNDYTQRTVLVAPYAQAISSSFNGPQNPSFMILMLSYLVLALTVVNLSSLLFMRSTSRKQELAVRATMGAGGAELAKQVLLESATICFTGLVLSLAFSRLFLNMIFSLSPNLSFWETTELNLQTVLVGFGVTVLIWLSSGLVVAYKAWKTSPGNMLSDTNKGVGSNGKGMASKVIVAVEVTLSCFLLFITGAMIVLLTRVAITEPGTSTGDTAFASFNLSHLSNSDRQNQLAFVDDLIREVAEIPGITEAAVTTAYPSRPGRYGSYKLESYTAADATANLPGQATIWITDNYFAAIGIDLIEGRGFDSSDSSDSENVVMITEEVARQFWPEESSLGKTINTRVNGLEESLRVVGTISSALKQDVLESELFVVPYLYRPVSQGVPENVFLLVKFQAFLAMPDLERAIRTAAVGIDRNVAIEGFRSLADSLAKSDVTIVIKVAETIALATLILAVIGVYAVLARSVTQRTFEIGIRRALGSTDLMVFLKFIKPGLYILLAGTLFGSVPALIGSVYAISSLGSSSQPIYLLPTVWLAVTLLMFAIIAVACYIPARIAIRKEPGDALRYE